MCSARISPRGSHQVAARAAKMRHFAGVDGGSRVARLPVHAPACRRPWCRRRSGVKLRGRGPAGMYTRLFARALVPERAFRSPALPRPDVRPMARLVMKFGGTSVADIERIRNVARHVKREVDAGHEVAVVVSAMAGKTNELVAWCRDAARAARCARIRRRRRLGRAGHRPGLLAIVLQGHGRPRPLLAGLAGADPHRRRPRRGAHRSTSTAPN